jgi:hypothetical protein
MDRVTISVARRMQRKMRRKDESTMTAIWFRTPAPLCLAFLAVAALLAALG